MSEPNDFSFSVPSEYLLWTPPAGHSIPVGPEQRPVPLPPVPLPVHREHLRDGEPSDQALGLGVYDYLRQYPDCRHNLQYARLLRDAFPYYLADLASQTAMLDHKEVDGHYVRRKINGLKILALLEPENPGLLQQLGIASFDLALTFTELPDCQSHLLAAMGFLQRSLAASPGEGKTLNLLGEIDFLLGDYPAAARRWRQVMEGLAPGPARDALAAKIGRCERLEVPDHPLLDELEAIGSALQAYAGGCYGEARAILEGIEEGGALLAEFPMPEFFYLLGMSRGKEGDAAGAFVAFDRALELDPDFAPALAGKDQVLEGKEF